ncbi:MAG: hypothetical protein JOZ42_18025, partial [Acetobacteraceae bacterium]|nr:hypothetical protein [Acetobacteraceae bacterium]
MTALADFHFLRPVWLLAAIPAWGLCWVFRRQADTTRKWRGVIEPDLWRHFV